MSYTIMIRQQARKKLQSLPKPDRLRIADKINRLGHNPDDPGLDVQKLEGEPGWRLRVGGWRVIFDRQDAVRIIAIEKIKPRGDAYK
ncbi:MAG: type II toxin-antitoxin system RelE/ParE family toxin [Burkholderiales bacterium]|nr:type II toxin-antitoxin system RelE/ParE family toxin [Burkholderiales bacterium]